MQVKFWGTRGSLPRPTSSAAVLDIVARSVEAAKKQGINDLDQYHTALKSGSLINPITYGGNTSCTQVSHGTDTVFVDAGTGLAFAGDEMMSKGQREFHLFMTHFHWDHIMGVPFFLPIYVPGMRVHIYHVHRTGAEDLKIQFNGRNFPVLWDQLGASIQFHQIKPYECTKIGKLAVTPFCLDHPGGSFGYRVDSEGASFAVGVDGEYKRFTPDELGKDLQFYQSLDVLAFDGQYEMDELVSRYDWGHCTPSIGVDLALREGIKTLVLTHHDPRSPDTKSLRMLDDAKTYLASHIVNYHEMWAKLGQPKGPNILSAYDGFTLKVHAKGIEVL